MKKVLFSALVSASMLLVMLSVNVLGDNNANASEIEEPARIESNDSTNYLNFTAIDDDATISYGSWGVNLEYSFDKSVWTSCGSETSVNIPAGQTFFIRLRESLEPIYPCGESFNISCDNGKVAAAGNIMSLVSSDCSKTTIDVEMAFGGFFSNFTCLISAPELPALSLAYGCYDSMFYGCLSLVNAPELPATSLMDNCYSDMFKNCSSLTQAPELPAETLTNCCYKGMFQNCSSLVDPPEILATSLAENCCELMFGGCTSLTSAPYLPATTLAPSCYMQMFFGCTSLTSAPYLPATTLAPSCYLAMFGECTSLTSAPYLPATTLAESCYGGMFSACTSLTQAPELPAETLASNCYGNMFYNCTSLTKGPELLADNLTNCCCFTMFLNCSKLDKISVKFSNWDDDELATLNWVDRVSETGTFICPAELDTETRDDSHVPAGWTVKHSYDIDIENPEHGQISATVVDNGNSHIFAEGDTIMLTYTSPEGYTLDKWSVKTADGTEIEVENDCFVMPSEDVVISASELAPAEIIPAESAQTGDNMLFVGILLAVLSGACLAYNLKKKFK